MGQEALTPIGPNDILPFAEKPVVLETGDANSPILEAVILEDGRKAYLIHNFHHNITNPHVTEIAQQITGYTGEEVHQIVESLVPIDGPMTMRGGVYAGRGGDKLDLDPGRREENVETMVVDELTLPHGEGAEGALVRMWAFGQLKGLRLPEGNPGHEVAWELTLLLKGDPLYVVVPKAVQLQGEITVAEDNGVILELKPGDAVISPLIPRQLISASPGASQSRLGSGSKYLSIGPAWDEPPGTNPNGISQEPVYWRRQLPRDS